MTVKELIYELSKFDENATVNLGFNAYIVEGTDEISFDAEMEAERVVNIGPDYAGYPQIYICDEIKRHDYGAYAI